MRPALLLALLLSSFSPTLEAQGAFMMDSGARQLSFGNVLETASSTQSKTSTRSVKAAHGRPYTNSTIRHVHDNGIQNLHQDHYGIQDRLHLPRCYPDRPSNAHRDGIHHVESYDHRVKNHDVIGIVEQICQYESESVAVRHAVKDRYRFCFTDAFYGPYAYGIRVSHYITHVARHLVNSPDADDDGVGVGIQDHVRLRNHQPVYVGIQDNDIEYDG